MKVRDLLNLLSDLPPEGEIAVVLEQELHPIVDVGWVYERNSYVIWTE